MRRAVLVAAIVAVVIAGVVAAVLVLGDDDSESLSTPEWADSVCTELVEWRSSITSLADVSGEMLTADVLRERLDEASAATDELVADLEALGPPDLEAGEDVEAALDDAAEGLRARYQELESAAAAAEDAATPTEFLQALAALAPRFQQLLDQIRETVAALQSASLFGEASGELEQAFAESDACRALEEQS